MLPASGSRGKDRYEALNIFRRDWLLASSLWSFIRSESGLAFLPKYAESHRKNQEPIQMDYDDLCSTLLDRIFVKSIWNEFLFQIGKTASKQKIPNEAALRAAGGDWSAALSVVETLNEAELKRIQWGFWAPSMVACTSACIDRCQILDIDQIRIIRLLSENYRQRMPRDNTRVTVGDYLRAGDDLRAVKKSGAVRCPLFGSIQAQSTTEGELAASISDHRLRTLSAAFTEGYKAYDEIKNIQASMGMPVSCDNGEFSRFPNRTVNGLLWVARTFTGMILDSGAIHPRESEMDIADLLCELLQDCYRDCCNDISECSNRFSPP